MTLSNNVTFGLRFPFSNSSMKPGDPPRYLETGRGLFGPVPLGITAHNGIVVMRKNTQQAIASPRKGRSQQLGKVDTDV